MASIDRPLTEGEIALARGVFGNAIDYDAVRIKRRRWFPFHPRRVLMSPMGHIHVHPKSPSWLDDYSLGDWADKGLFIHEMTHVWQAQKRGRWYLVLMRYPFSRYDYALRPGWPLERYGLEQQAEIVRHAFLLRSGRLVRGAQGKEAYQLLVNFPGATLSTITA